MVELRAEASDVVRVVFTSSKGEPDFVMQGNRQDFKLEYEKLRKELRDSRQTQIDAGARVYVIQSDVAEKLEAVLRDWRPTKDDVGWRPIATAPMDGTTVLITDGGLHEIASWSGRLSAWTYRIESAVFYACQQPTHWMPLPEAPR